MSRISRSVLKIPAGVSCNLDHGFLNVVGPRGSLSLSIPKGIVLSLSSGGVLVDPSGGRRISSNLSSLSGTVARLSRNMIQGVLSGFSISLDLIGVGYRAELQGNRLRMTLGFSHDIFFQIPEGISIKVEKPTAIKIEGIDKQLVGQVAAQIRKFRPPEPYKGKGIHRSGEYIRRKEGKSK